MQQLPVRVVPVYPPCAFCGEEAYYEGYAAMNLPWEPDSEVQWLYMCEEHMISHGVGLAPAEVPGQPVSGRRLTLRQYAGNFHVKWFIDTIRVHNYHREMRQHMAEVAGMVPDRDLRDKDTRDIEDNTGE